MNTHTAPHVIHVERLSGGVVVTFADGKCALYSASLLYDISARAEDMNFLYNPDDDEE